jgi:CheY-like chemotaxis protein
VLALVGLGVSNADAQVTRDGFVNGAAEAAWSRWETAMNAILARDADAAEAAFAQLLATNPSPFRIALMAERTVMRTSAGGAVLVLEQDYQSQTLRENGKRVGEMLVAGREQMNQADDGWYFCAIGRFDVANANFQALLASDPDPVALLEFADRVARRQDILVQVATNPIVGESARAILRLLDEGERIIKADPVRIKEHIEELAGPPRMYSNAVARLRESGEYAIPFLIQYLRDPAQRELVPLILRTLPQIGRPALNPLVISLRMNDATTKVYLVRALGQIGYGQAVPYLLRLRSDSTTTPDVNQAVDAALQQLAARGVTMDVNAPAPEAFLRLAVAYFENQSELAADPRLEAANVWYWRDDLLENVEIPTPIFNEVMCMRCCEEALLLDSSLEPAQALWLAANFRRDAQLGDDQTDPTRPPNYPSPAYFAQSAGPKYCLMALARAVDERDPVVALGMIEALRKTAGPASVGAPSNGRQPLGEALLFPDRLVRIRAALALGRAQPATQFHNYQNLVGVLAEALGLHGGARNALVVEGDATVANALSAGLRAEGYTVVSDATLAAGLDKVRQELAGVDVILIASDVQSPELAGALAQLRGEFSFALTPTLVITKPAQRSAVRTMVRADHRLGEVSPADGPDQLRTAITRVSRAVGATPISPELGLALAQEAAETLLLLAMTHNTILDPAGAEAALLATLGTDDGQLRLTVARVLSFLSSSAAHSAVAAIALNEAEAAATRVAMFAIAADAAKRHGNLLSPAAVEQLTRIAESDENLVIREAASQLLGALNLPGDPASVIIRNQYGG